MLKLRRAFQAWSILLWVAVVIVASQDTPRSSITVNFNSNFASEATPTPSMATANTTTAKSSAKATPRPPPPAAGPKTKATPSPNAPSSPALANDMRAILRKVGPLPCSESVRAHMFALLYESNVELHDQCIAESGYQFFPYTGELPTAAQILAIVKSTPCMQIESAVILGKFPECDIDFVSVRTAAETYLRIKKDVDDGRTPPTQAQFYELYNLNRVVNLLNENTTLIEDAFRDTPTSASVSLTEMTRLMNPIILSPGVSLGDDMKITITEDPASKSRTSSSDGSTGSAMEDVETTPTPIVEDEASSNTGEAPVEAEPVKTHPPVVNETTRASSASFIHHGPSHVSAALSALVATCLATMVL